MSSGTKTAVHAIVDTPLHGDESKWNMATVISGEHAGKTVVVLIEFSDGWCICDMGDDAGMEIIKIGNMRLWTPVRAVVVRDGKTFFDPL